MSIIGRAAKFAYEAHDGQVRKYTGVPYVYHCQEVARRVWEQTGDEEMAAAAWLHDTVEDTDVTIDDITDAFGTRVAGLVLALTDVYTSEAWSRYNRRDRKIMETRRLATISDDAKLIKLADIADNTSSIVEHDPKFAAVYLVEKAAMLEVLT